MPTLGGGELTGRRIAFALSQAAQSVGDLPGHELGQDAGNGLLGMGRELLLQLPIELHLIGRGQHIDLNLDPGMFRRQIVGQQPAEVLGCRTSNTLLGEEQVAGGGEPSPADRGSDLYIREFFRSRGVASFVEADGCVFPASNRAADICNALVQEAQARGVQFRYRTRVRNLAAEGPEFRLDSDHEQLHAGRVILATGGVSWPQTGSRGDGYRFAAQLGHTVIPPKPSLVPLIARETWPHELAGISLPDVEIRASGGGRKLATTGNLLFTQKGIGGPAAQDLSRLLADDLAAENPSIEIQIDVLPATDEMQLDRQLQQQFAAHPKKAVASILAEIVPRQVSRTLCSLAQCEGDAPAGQFSAAKRRQLVWVLKKLPLRLIGTEPIAKATVTRGGVSRDEIDPRTMESKIRPGLFFAGEVIDADGPCGGYNLQMCWSTGALAGRSAARSLRGDKAST